jgi:peptide/nickel transport system permease protein
MSAPTITDVSVPLHDDTDGAAARNSATAGAAQWFTRNKWWIYRTLWLPVHVAIFTTVAFFLVRLVPGDPVLTRLQGADSITKKQYDAVAKQMGLDGSIWHQLGNFWVTLLHGSLGVSQVTGRGVWGDIMSRLPATIELIGIGLFWVLVVSFGLAFLWLRFSSRPLRIVLNGYSKLAGAIPEFALAVLGLALLYTILHVIPAPIGRVDPSETLPTVTGFPILDTIIKGRWDLTWSILAHYLLPEVVIVLAYVPHLWKQLVLGIEEAAAAPATMFKIASGATRGAIYRSVFRRAAASSVVMMGAMFGGLIGGVVVLEQLFGFGGVGQYAVNAVTNNDFLALQGFLIVIAALCLIVFFLVDIVNQLLDPRRRPGAKVD